MFRKSTVTETPIASIGDKWPENQTAPEGSLHFNRTSLTLYVKERDCWQVLGGVALLPTPLFNRDNKVKIQGTMPLGQDK